MKKRDLRPADPEPFFCVPRGAHLPGLGLIAGLLLIFILGMAANNVVAAARWRCWTGDHRIPLALAAHRKAGPV